MKKIFGITLLNLLFFVTTLKAQVSVEAFPAQPQSGIYNYFGVRAKLTQTYDHNVTVTGYIYDDGNAPNTNNPFSLIVTAGNLTSETEATFYVTNPTGNAVVVLGTIATTYAGAFITYEAINGSILKFNNVADVNAVINQLDADYDAYNDDYDSQYPNLTAEQLDDMDEQNGFDEFKKFKDFENLFGGFYSKRSEIENIEIFWLSSNFTSTDPDDVDLTFDDVENTIFNSNYSFKVGNNVYQLTSSGMYINGVLQDNGGNSRILNNKSNIMFASEFFFSNGYNSGPMAPTDYLTLQDEMFLDDQKISLSNMTICKSNKKVKMPPLYYENNTRRMDTKVAINSIAIKSSVKAKAVHFMKKNGNWKRSRVKMAVGCAGKVYDGDCSNSFQFAERKPDNGFKMRKQLKAIFRSQVGIPSNSTIWKTMSGEIGGTVHAPDANIAGNIILTF